MVCFLFNYFRNIKFFCPDPQLEVLKKHKK